MAEKFEITIQRYSELTKIQLYQIMKLRNRVFVVGQKITAEPDIDGKDPSCHHVLARPASNPSVLAGTARIFESKNPPKIGRVAVDPEYRSLGLGSRIMHRIHNHFGDRDKLVLNAQAHLREWYEQLGWRAVGELFEEADIPHIRMILTDPPPPESGGEQ